MASTVIEGRTVFVRPWRYIVHGVHGHEVPVYFLDADLPENAPQDRQLTGDLYGGDDAYRLRQEALLGMGGISLLRQLGHDLVQSYHLNEGHSALIAIALLQERLGSRPLSDANKADYEWIRHHCIFTTHTPVPAGMDNFDLGLARRVLGPEMVDVMTRLNLCLSTLNMTYLAMASSHYINGVSMRHEEVAHTMFPNYPVNAITNGVHAVTWASDPFRRLFDKHLPEWRRDNLYLRYAISIPLSEVLQAHAEAKAALLDAVVQRTGVSLDPARFTVGFARRATAYKRADLVFTDLNRLKAMAKSGLQLVYAGKAHPHDGGGKAMIRRVFAAAKALKGTIDVVYLPEYDAELARLFCSGVDLWLNTPKQPEEASGTSGMKAAINGVPSLSVLDGWWIEGCFEGVTGWAVGDDWANDGQDEASDLYRKLSDIILPMFYDRPGDYAQVMRSAIAINGAYYNAQRMLGQYLENAYWQQTE